jgi:hypothetical protein
MSTIAAAFFVVASNDEFAAVARSMNRRVAS